MPVETYKHSRAISPFFWPFNQASGDDFHGITDIAADVSQATEDVFILGKKNKCGTERDIPENTVPVTQLERGEINSFLILSNLTSEPSGGFTLDDFSSAEVDVALFVREEENGTLEATIWGPKTAINTFNLSIDADDRIVRTFDLIGENRRILEGSSNKFLIRKQDTAPSGTSGAYSIDVSDPTPVADPFNTGSYIFRVDRKRSGTTTTLTKTTDWSYDSGDVEVDIVDAQSGDIFTIWYSAASFGSAGDPTSTDADATCFLKAENATIIIKDYHGTTVELDNLTSLSLDASLDRLNEATIGTTDKIKEISETPVTLSLTARAKKDFTVERAFMGDVDATNLVSDVNNFLGNVTVLIKIYDNSDKDNFLIGYKIENLAFNDSSFSVTSNEFAELDFNSSTTDITISNTEGNIA